MRVGSFETQTEKLIETQSVYARIDFAQNFDSGFPKTPSLLDLTAAQRVETGFMARESFISHAGSFQVGYAMSTIRETRRILRAYRITPKKRLGQNFIVDVGLMNRMVSYAQISANDVVLEIGAGLGFLTRLLAERCKRVIAVELDPKLAKILRNRLSNLENVTILEGDILRLPISPFSRVVSTPPYSISSPILFWLLERDFELSVLTFQKEFADRLVAQPNSSDYSRLTVSTYYQAEVDLLDPVPREAFWPQPSVDSVIVRLRPRKPPFHVKDERLLFELVRGLFTQRNKKVKNAIKGCLKSLNLSDRETLKRSAMLPFVNRRTRELAPEEFGVIANEIADRMHEKGLL